MTGTFSSLNTAVSAMRHQQVAMDVASGNVANAGTPGYARRQVVGQATGASATPALWSRWGVGSGDGVQSGPITRMVDPLLDARARTEHAGLFYADARAASLVRFETTIGEPGDNGVGAALTAFKAGWHDVANNPGDTAARSQLLARAETLWAAVGAQDRAVTTEWSNQRDRLGALGQEVDGLATQLADVNKALRSSHVAGTDAGVLLDQRDQLTMRLAELTGSTVTMNGDTTVDVRVGGVALVTGATAATVTVSGSATLDGAGTAPVRLGIGGTDVVPPAGETGAVLRVLTTDLPRYRAGLDAFVATLAADTNAQHQQGVDLAGAAGGAFFGGTTAASLTVQVADPAAVAAGAPGRGTLDNGNATALGALDLGAGDYRRLVTSFGVSVGAAKQSAANQAVMAAQVDGSREALSGISIDEEMVNLLAAQRAYEGAARVLTTMDSVLDTLINRTGAR